jgi:hypothetical protein
MVIFSAASFVAVIILVVDSLPGPQLKQLDSELAFDILPPLKQGDSYS